MQINLVLSPKGELAAEGQPAVERAVKRAIKSLGRTHGFRVEQIKPALSPCPFCSCHHVELRKSPSDDLYAVECIDCAACGPAFSEADRASEGWNNRTP